MGSFIVAVSFVLLDRKIPHLLEDFDGTWWGSVRILTTNRPHHVAKNSTWFAKLRLPSCAPYFVYKTTKMHVNTIKCELFMEPKEPLCQFELPQKLTSAQALHLVNECASQVSSSALEPIKTFLQDYSKRKIRVSEFLLKPGAEETYGKFCDLFRLQYTRHLFVYLVHNAHDTNQRDAVLKMPFNKLKACCELLLTKPWKFIFYKVLKQFSLAHGISEASYHAVISHKKLNPSQKVKDGTTMYFYMEKQRSEHGHTCVSQAELETVGKAGAYAGLAYLDKHKAAHRVNPEYWALAIDVRHAEICIQFFKRIQQHHHAEPVMRGPVVPVIPPELTQDQHGVALHILCNWITVVEGLPGTGKTAIITWAMAQFRNVLLVSFIGMMVKTLQKRCNHHTEAAHTIHRVLTAHEFTKYADKWLEEFEVLIIDEISNVEMPLFAALLGILPNISKVIFVGDHEQLFPIGPGDPMGDLLAVFGSKRLTQNLRVENLPNASDLSNAPRLIASGEANKLQFRPGGPLTLVSKSKDKGLDRVKATLRPLFKDIAKLPEGTNLMRSHVIVLNNTGPDGRRILNQACEEVLIEIGLLRKRGVVKLSTGTTLYVGKKITFTQNYNTPFSFHDKWMTDPVGNGELAIIQSIEKLGGDEGYKMIITDGDNQLERVTKVVWISKKSAVDPIHITDGFATTTYKIQGNEMPYVFFWLKDHVPNGGGFYTREHCYVALSRGKKRVWVIGEKRDLLQMCKYQARSRRTVFQILLRQHDWDSTNLNRIYGSQDVMLSSKMRLMPEQEECVPTITSTRKRLKQKSKVYKKEWDSSEE